jgi:small ligand-binding sensory domain FIST
MEKKSSTEEAADWIKNMDTRKVINSAQQLLHTAVNVLEEEIAAGVLAAKKLEEKIIDVDALRGGPDDLMKSIRRNTHDAVDIFLDAVTLLTNHISTLTASVNTEKKRASERTGSKNGFRQ